MKVFRLLTLGAILFLLPSCAGIYPCRKQFTIYKNTILQPQIKFPIKTNGVYVSTNQGGSFYLYDNGYAKTVSMFFPDSKLFWENPENQMTELHSEEDYFRKEVWGNYKFIDDTIIIQTFGLNDQLCKRSVYETKGIILNDTTIKVFSDYSFWFDSELIKEPNIYRLYKTEHKPDSTLAWFNKKYWYIKNLHESRK